MPYAETRAGRLYYEQHGQGDALLCIQGLALDVSGWRAQLPAWSAHHAVTVFDNRDVGRSFYADAPYDIHAMAADTMQLADGLGLERFHLLGNSMGGAIAQEVALAAPERVCSLTLCVSYGGSGTWGAERARLDLAVTERLSDEELARELMLMTLSESSFDQLAGEIDSLSRLLVSYPHRQRRDGYMRQLQASATHEARARLSSLKLPVHVIGADQDMFVPAWKSRELAQLIPGARLSMIAGAAHAVNLERTAEYNALVLEFLAGVRDHEPTTTAAGQAAVGGP